MEHLLYHEVDYDDIVYNEVSTTDTQLEGYTLYDLRDYEGKKFKYPFFKIVQLGKKYGTNMKVALIGAPLYKE